MQLEIKASGITLAELVITLALVAILAGIAAPSLTQLVTKTRHTSLVNETHQMFNLARAHAIHHNTLTTICPLSSALRCVDDWNAPVSVFPDHNNDRRPDDAHIHRTFELAKGHSRIYSRTAGRGYFQLAPDGMSHGTMGSLYVCSDSNADNPEMSYLALSIGGRLRTLHDDDGDGEITLPWGVTITCPSA